MILLQRYPDATTAFRQGYIAYHQNTVFGDNPYLPSEDQYALWQEGYDQAEADMGEA